MEQRLIKISPAGFALLHEELWRAELEGFGPDTAARYAMLRVGLEPKEGVETVLEVDPKLDGPIWPFMEWPTDWDRHDQRTWR